MATSAMQCSALHANVNAAAIASSSSALLRLRQPRSSPPSLQRLPIDATALPLEARDGEPRNYCPVSRRDVLSGVAAAFAAATASGDSALAVGKPPKGFAAVLDNNDGYAFLYPFGWQEVAVKGQDVAFKDVIEPLESVSVSIIKTDKTSLEELGSPDAVAKALVERVLSSPSQKTALKEATARVTNGRTYYQFEFMVQAKNFTRHALGAVAVNGGKFYTLTTGANERRWDKVEEKLRQVVDSFQTL